MEFLSEDRIKRAGLRFLKSHYRQRERSGSGETYARYDVKTEGGIIADGHLSFEATNGLPFTATLEATSAETKNEVTYKVQYTILFWDSLAVASILSALVFSYSFAFNQFTIKQIGLIPSILLLLILILIIGIVYQRLFRWKNRYHYIYAIEQFKKYHADEQWIAIGEDVFESSEDEVLWELKEQCILNGFGLIEVDFEGKATLMITPSRIEVFGKKRDKLSFEPRDNAAKRGRLARFKQVWNEKVVAKIRIPGTQQLKRYQLGYLRQAMLSAFAFFLIGEIFHRELNQTEFVYLDETEYVDSMQRFSQQTFPEFEEYLLDTPFVDPVKKVPGYLTQTEENITITEISKEIYSDPSSEKEVLEIQAVPNEPFNVILADKNGRQTRYSCERLFSSNGTYYLALDNSYSSPRQALKRVARLISADIPVNAFNRSCFVDGDPQYLVYYDLFYVDKKDAEETAKKIRRLLKKKGFSNNNITIHTIEINR